MIVGDIPHPQVTQNLASTSTQHLGPLLPHPVTSLLAGQQEVPHQQLGGCVTISQVRLCQLQT